MKHKGDRPHKSEEREDQDQLEVDGGLPLYAQQHHHPHRAGGDEIEGQDPIQHRRAPGQPHQPEQHGQHQRAKTKE
ncbi:MAG: hypothetical protein M5U12_16000 [Verrucomicrobia bacterium]|nr:hypothetical protein [Verrucomicrobiota bacterium]